MDSDDDGELLLQLESWREDLQGIWDLEESKILLVKLILILQKGGIGQ